MNLSSLSSSVLTSVISAFLISCNSKPTPDLVVSGRIEVDNIHIGSKIGGRVAAVNYEEGDLVPAGKVVVQLEDRELLAGLEQAQASAAQTSAQLELLNAGTRVEDLTRAEAVVAARKAELQLRRSGFRAEEIRQAEAELVSAKSEFDLSEREYQRSGALLKNRAIDQSEFDRAHSNYETARAKLEVARQRESMMKSGSRPEEIQMAEAQLKQAEADLERLRHGPRPEEIAAQRAGFEAALANVKVLQAQLEETRIVAPTDSVVETLDLESGDLVKPGETVAVLNLRNKPWVRCYVPENRLSAVKPGLGVSVSVDSAPGKLLKGTVRRISSEAEFTPRNVQTTEKRSELVFEMKVDLNEGAGFVRAGMYADVHVQPAHQ